MTQLTNINNNVQTMTSLEIAELTGKQHKNLMRDIRNMEPAWENIAGLKFELGSYKDANGQLRPCYVLTKTECLYIARWQELETGNVRRKLREVKLLTCDNDILKESEMIVGRELERLNGDLSEFVTTTDIAKTYGLEVKDLISFLRDKKVLMPRGRQRLTSQYSESGLAEDRHCCYYSLKGELKESIYLVWTLKGAQFIHKMIQN